MLTDVNGKYLFSGLPLGNYKVQVLIGDVPDAQDRTLRFTTASSEPWWFERDLTGSPTGSPRCE